MFLNYCIKWYIVEFLVFDERFLDIIYGVESKVGENREIRTV